LTVLNVLDGDGWKKFVAGMRSGFPEQFKEEDGVEKNEEEYAQNRKMFESFPWAMAYIAPRGIGPTAWKQDDRSQTQTRRRFMLLGQTWHGMQVWDVRRAVQAIRDVKGFKDAQLWLQGEGNMAGIALYAAVFEPNIHRLDLWNLSRSHHEGPIFLNVLRFMDVPQAVAMAGENTLVRIYQEEKTGWEYPQQVSKTLGWVEKQIQIRTLPEKEKEADSQ
jgi:hypothetical protein